MEEFFKIDFLTEINYIRLFLDIILLYLCSKAIEFVYKKYGYSNDNKYLFTKHMFPYLISIFLIVSVIKTSIALSLGLVGALSIIRFRTAIKEAGQLITLLILTALAISMAAEKELLGIIVTLIYCFNSFKNYENVKTEDFTSSKKIIRLLIENPKIEIHQIIKLKNFDRIYKDSNQNIYLELILKNDEDYDSLITQVKKYGNIISYEIF